MTLSVSFEEFKVSGARRVFLIALAESLKLRTPCNGSVTRRAAVRGLEQKPLAAILIQCKFKGTRWRSDDITIERIAAHTLTHERRWSERWRNNKIQAIISMELRLPNQPLNYSITGDGLVAFALSRASLTFRKRIQALRFEWQQSNPNRLANKRRRMIRSVDEKYSLRAEILLMSHYVWHSKQPP